MKHIPHESEVYAGLILFRGPGGLLHSTEQGIKPF